MYSYQGQNSKFPPIYDEYSKKPQLQLLDEDYGGNYENSLVMDIFGSYSPLLILPPRTNPKSDNRNKAKDEVQKLSTSQRKRHKKQRPGAQETCHETITEESAIDAVSAESINGEDLVASSCCHSAHCHHYAYAPPNTHSYMGFVDNLFNGMAPDLFVRLQFMYKELHTFIKQQPLGLYTIRCSVDAYVNSLRGWRLRRLHCVRSVLSLITQLLDLYERFLDEADERSLGDDDAVEFFYDLDSLILQTVTASNHDSDLAETAKPVENFVYRSTYSWLVTYLRAAYLDMTHTVGVPLPWGMHKGIVAGAGATHKRLLHLGMLADAIREERSFMLPKVHDMTRDRLFLRDGSYGQDGRAWSEFLDEYLGGSLAGCLDRERDGLGRCEVRRSDADA